MTCYSSCLNRPGRFPEVRLYIHVSSFFCFGSLWKTFFLLFLFPFLLNPISCQEDFSIFLQIFEFWKLSVLLSIKFFLFIRVKGSSDLFPQKGQTKRAKELIDRSHWDILRIRKRERWLGGWRRQLLSLLFLSISLSLKQFVFSGKKSIFGEINMANFPVNSVWFLHVDRHIVISSLLSII